jgi:hypothetical protein
LRADPAVAMLVDRRSRQTGDELMKGMTRKARMGILTLAASFCMAATAGPAIAQGGSCHIPDPASGSKVKAKKKKGKKGQGKKSGHGGHKRGHRSS